MPASPPPVVTLFRGGLMLPCMYQHHLSSLSLVVASCYHACLNTTCHHSLYRWSHVTMHVSPPPVIALYRGGLMLPCLPHHHLSSLCLEVAHVAMPASPLPVDHHSLQRWLHVTMPRMPHHYLSSLPLQAASCYHACPTTTCHHSF